MAYPKATKAIKSEGNKTEERGAKGKSKRGKGRMGLPLLATTCSYTTAGETESCCLRRQLLNSQSQSKLALLFR